MLSIKEKLRALQEEKLVTYTDKVLSDIFGKNFQRLLIDQPEKPYSLLPFKEDGQMYVSLIKAYKKPYTDEFVNFAFETSIESGYFYKEVNDSMLNTLKRYRTFHQEQLNALDTVFSDKKYRLKGIL